MTARRPAFGGPGPSSLLSAFFPPAIAFLALGAAVGIAHAAGAGDRDLRWLSLHLLLLGGVSQLILGAGQFFSCAFLATSPPSRRMLGAQLACWNAGTLLIATGHPLVHSAPVTHAGAVLIAAGVALFFVALRGMEARSLQRARWALRWYHACAACLAAGTLVGAVMASNTLWTHGSLLGAHLALNIGGWCGTAIVGTLHTFYPSLTGTPLRHARLQGPTFAAWLAGIVLLAAGAAFGAVALVAAGWLCALTSAFLLGVNMLASVRATQRLSPTAGVLAAAQAPLVAGMLLALVETIRSGATAPFVGETRPVLAALLLGGWLAPTVLASLVHLLKLLARVRRLRPGARTAHP